MDEIVNDFLIESAENLDRLDQELVKLESDPQSKELLASIFRTIHTIKGSCGFLGFTRLEKVAHAGENLLSRLRDGVLSLTAEVTSGLLAMVDAVRHMLSEIRATGHDGENDYPELLAELERLHGGGKPSLPSAMAGVATDPAVTVEPASPSAGACGPASPDKVSDSVTATLTVPVPAASAAPSGTAAASYLPAPGKMGGVLVERGSIRPEDLATALREQEHGDRRRLGEILVALGVCKLDDVLVAQQIIEGRGREVAAETIRVGVNLLDELMNLVGELVLARNQLLQFSRSSKDKGLQAVSQRVNLVASKLQEKVMKTRMQPIGNLWNKFPRTVRDLALSCSKEVRLEMEGQETELDRTIIEAIKDPLTHLVRNAIDHGIEAPQERRKAGKESAGVLRLRAFHESGQVHIEISDDGAGLNTERLRKKAIDRGVVSEAQAAGMSERDIFNLIFLPGFSTAEKVTNVSGRGVGMDVVRTNVEKIGGTVEVESARGKGATVRVRIPLTLAIIPALMVRCSGERFAIPQISLTELVRLEGGKGVEWLQGSPVYRLRGRLLPLVSLSEVLQPQSNPQSALLSRGGPKDLDCTAARQKHERAQNLGSVNVAVLQAQGREFGLIVDDILDSEEIVVKPLGKQLKGISVYAGATILGDGGVALILDVKGLAAHGRLRAQAQQAAPETKPTSLPDVLAEGGERQSLILAKNGRETHVAIPLQTVARLEEFPASVIQHAGDWEVMPYRGHIIPLLRLSNFLPGSAPAEPGATSIQVVVCSEGRRTMGLIVDRIVDIVEQAITLESVNQRPGVSGTCMIDRNVTDILDIAAIVRTAAPGYLEGTTLSGAQ